MQSGSYEPIGRSNGVKRRYKLKLWQQPSRARLCSYKEENDTIDRRPIDPPPVVEMQAFDTDLTDTTSFFIRASIVHPDPDGDDYTAVKTPTGADAAAGDTIQTPERLVALDGMPGSVVVFAKLNVRVPGTFRLKFTLYETSDSGIAQITHTFSEPFVVYSPKLFKGMNESTALTRHLAGQGYKVKLRTDTSIGRQSNSRKRAAQEPESTSSTPRPFIQGTDDGLMPSLRDLSRTYNVSPLSTDPSAFSLDAPRIRYTRSIPSLLDPPPSHLGRDDGTPYFPVILPPLRNNTHS